MVMLRQAGGAPVCAFRQYGYDGQSARNSGRRHARRWPGSQRRRWTARSRVNGASAPWRALHRCCPQHAPAEPPLNLQRPLATSQRKIPRSLRDIVVTEYGVADLRGKSDRDTIAQMLAVADSAFQPQLRGEAQRAGKLEPDFVLSDRTMHNCSQRIEAALAPARQQGLLPAFPLGSDMTETEALLVAPLQDMKEASYGVLLRFLALGMVAGRLNPAECAALKRLGLDAPRTARDRALGAIVTGALRF